MEGIEVRLLNADSLKYKYAEIPKYVYEEVSKPTEYVDFIDKLKNERLYNYFLEGLKSNTKYSVNNVDIPVISFIDTKDISISKKLIGFNDYVSGVRPVLKFNKEVWPFSQNMKEDVIVEYGIYPKQVIKTDCSNFNDEPTGEEFEFNYEIDQFFDKGKTPIYAKKDEKGNIKYRYIKAKNNNYLVLLDSIEWITAKDNTLVSKDVIDIYHFCDETADSFEESNFYKWLNTTFINNLTISKDTAIKIIPNGRSSNAHVTLLEKSEVANPFSLVRKYDNKNKINYNIIDCKDDYNIKANYILRSTINYQYTYDCDEKKILYQFKNCGTYRGIRPVLEFAKEDFPFNNQNNGDIVTYGTYPSGGVVSKDLPLIDTHKTIMFRENGRAPIYKDMNTEIEYVRVYGYSKEYNDYELKPVKWIVDKTNSRLISCDVIDFVNYFIFDYRIKFEDTDKYKWLNSYFLSSLQLENYVLPKKEKVEIQEPIIEEETVSLLKDISLYLDYYKGNRDIKSEVNNCISEYNNELRLLGSDNKMAGTNDAHDLRTNLILKLETYLDLLKNYSSKTKDYYDMLKIIKECQNDNISISLDSICEDINKIKIEILPFIDNIEIENELNNILLDEEKTLNEDIINIDNSNYILTIDELKKRFISKLYPYLLKLNKAVIDKDIILNTKEEIVNGIKETYDDSKNDLIGLYLKTINEVSLEIRNKANSNELERFSEITNINLDETNILDFANSLRKECIDLYHLLNDINNRLFVESELNKYIINYNLDNLDDYVKEKSI